MSLKLLWGNKGSVASVCCFKILCLSAAAPINEQMSFCSFHEDTRKKELNCVHRILSFRIVVISTNMLALIDIVGLGIFLRVCMKCS